MAEMTTLKTRLNSRLSGFTDSFLEGLITEAAIEHGYSAVANIPSHFETPIVLKAWIIGLQKLATDGAAYFSFKSSGQSVDKSMVSQNYAKMIPMAEKEYNRSIRRASGGQLNLTRTDGR